MLFLSGTSQSKTGLKTLLFGVNLNSLEAHDSEPAFFLEESIRNIFLNLALLT